MFKSIYDSKRFRYIDRNIDSHKWFDRVSNRELLPKTACFFSDNLDVYIDTSDGVNEDLQSQEYIGRALKCIDISRGKKILFFKSAYSKKWSNNIDELLKKNNGKLLPFFKWSFNDNFYNHTVKNIQSLREKTLSSTPNLDLGLFADFSKTYEYPKSAQDCQFISWEDVNKFKLYHIFGLETSANTGYTEIRSREKILSKLKNSNFNFFHGSLSYKQYMEKSIDCKIVLNPPGIGEYTSRMMDQTAIGNLIVLRKNSYDNAISWKDYIPEIDFSEPNWEEKIDFLIANRRHWMEKGKFYFDNFWSPNSVFNYLVGEIEKNM